MAIRPRRGDQAQPGRAGFIGLSRARTERLLTLMEWIAANAEEILADDEVPSVEM